MTTDELKRRLEVAQAFARGEECEGNCGNGWQGIDFNPQQGYHPKRLFDDDFAVRIKPKPKLVPWESIEEVPLGDWFRRKDLDEPKMERITQCSRDYVWFNQCHFHRDMRDLFDSFEHASDPKHGKWFPCGKEVEG